jgi:predicted nucleic acid-binding protein
MEAAERKRALPERPHVRGDSEGRSGTATRQAPDALESWLELELQARFSGRILSIDKAVADRWGVLAAGAKRAARPLSAMDGLLAATALHYYGLTLVSRNISDFASTQVPVLNPWEP